jgi:hypothetical protein
MKKDQSKKIVIQRDLDAKVVATLCENDDTVLN